MVKSRLFSVSMFACLMGLLMAPSVSPFKVSFPLQLDNAAVAMLGSSQRLIVRRDVAANASGVAVADSYGSSSAYYYSDSSEDGTCSFVSQCWQKCNEPVQLDKGQKGVQGPVGPKGHPGVDGSTGLKGEKGGIGAVGDIGSKGPQGAPGDKGEKGIKGKQGARGADAFGERGDKGDRGQQGDGGEMGRQGCKGEKGQIGAVGAVGDQGSQGDTGAIGETGPEGAKGADGPVGPPALEAGEEGPQGEKGTNGDKGPVGSPGGAGEKGEKGRAGRPGSKITVNVTHLGVLPIGEPGDQGDPGNCTTAEEIGKCHVPGSKGEKGDVGDMGEKGQLGDNGERGKAGPSKTCKTDASDFIVIKGNVGRPGSKPPMVLGEKGDRADDKVCSCDALKCPPNITIPCTPRNDSVPCLYQLKKIPSRPGARGPKGEVGDKGPKGNTEGPKGVIGDRGLRGQCEKCLSPDGSDEFLVSTAPSIYVLHENAATTAASSSSSGNRFRRSSSDQQQQLSCASGDHAVLWRGYSFVGAVVDGKDSLHDFGKPGACLDFGGADNLPGKTVVSFTNVVEIPSAIGSLKPQLDRSTSQKALWLGANNKPTRCVVCQSFGPLSVFHGHDVCPTTDKRNLRYVKLWDGRSLAMIEGDNGAYRHGVKLESTASCVPNFGLVSRSACPNGQDCPSDGQEENVNSYWMASSRGGATKPPSKCVVCALEPLPDAKPTLKGDGTVFVQHSQVGSLVSPGCKAGHTELFNGYSLLSSTDVGGQTSSCSSNFLPLVTATSCVMSKNSNKRFCQPQVQHSTWMLSADYVTTIYERGVTALFHSSSSNGNNKNQRGSQQNRRVVHPQLTPAYTESLFVRKHTNTELETFQRNFVSRCSVCLSRAPIYVRHGLEASNGDTSNLTCQPGYSKLWHGYSFLMATSNDNGRLAAKDLSAPESCLRSFEPIIAIDCPSSENATAIAAATANNNGRQPSIANYCKFPFTANRRPLTLAAGNNVITSHWLANPNGNIAAGGSNGEEGLFGEKQAKLVSRCVVCELNL